MSLEQQGPTRLASRKSFKEERIAKKMKFPESTGIGRKSEPTIHRVQEHDLEELDMSREYDVERVLGEGSFAKILLATHRKTQTRVVLKAVHQELTSARDFFHEFHYSYHLSPHPNILVSYAVAFKADDCFVFAQEYAPYGDLADNVRAGGLPEDTCKKIAAQLSSALDFLHSKQLVHRDVKLENVLVFAPDASKVKLCDFGSTKREGSLAKKTRCTWAPFQPPEIHEIVSNERYTCKPSADCWQFAIVLFVCLTGNTPWQTADLIQDPDYSNFQRWHKRRTTKIPAQCRKFTPRLLRYFRRAFEHKPEKRAQVTEINKYLKDGWLVGRLSHSATSTSVDVQSAGETINNHQTNGQQQQQHVVNHQTKLQQQQQQQHHLGCCDDSVIYLDALLDHQHHHHHHGRGPGNGIGGTAQQQHCDESKNRLRKLLTSYGLETQVDQKDMTRRIWDWVMQCDANLDCNNIDYNNGMMAPQAIEQGI